MIAGDRAGTVGRVRVAVGSDEPGPTVDAVVAWCVQAGHEVVAPAAGAVAPWADVGRSVGEAVARGGADWGVVMCWTGTGVSIAANKVPGVRAALCTDAATAAGARRWNDANVLAIGMRLATPAVAIEMCEAFAGTEVDDAERAVINRLESGS